MWIAACLFLVSPVAGNSVTQIRASASAREGLPVKLNCQYSTTYTYYALGWYQQLPGQQPLFLLYRDERGNEYKPSSVPPRFSSELSIDVKSFTLSIEEAQRADSAVYFCALWDWGLSWGTREKLIFGKGTTVTVEPKNQEPSPPSVFVVKSANAKPSDGNKLTAACLVKDFFPNNVKVNMSGEADTVYKSKEGILSSNGKYSMMQVVKVEPNEEVGCYVTQEGRSYNRTQAQSATTPAPINTTQVCESSNSTVEEPNMEKVNMLSVTVLGLRVLLAKSIAFNMLMTVKLFIF